MAFVLFVEGKTEQKVIAGFLKRWLDARLSRPVRINPVKFEGWAELVKDLSIKTDLYLQKNDVIAVISIIDIYGPTIYPPKKTNVRDRYEWGKGHLESKVNKDRYFHFFAVHEFEAWLLSDPAMYKPADMLCGELFKKRCLIKHPDLNFRHDEKWRRGKNTALKQAVVVLLDAKTVLIDNGNPDNHGEKRYIEKVLLIGAGALKKTGSDGAVSYFACETDPAKIHDDFPVFKALCDRLANLNPGEMFSVGAFIEEARKAPYGVGGAPLLLMLAYVIRAYGERLIVYKDSTKMVEHVLRSYDDLVKIVSDPAARIVFVVRDISQAQMSLIDLVAKAVNAPLLKHGETRSLNAVFESLKQLHNGYYDDDLEQTVARFSDWYISEYPSIHKDPDLSLTHCLRAIASGGSESGLTIILLIDCLPLSFVEILHDALCNIGLSRHDMNYRFAGLPTDTGHNKAALLGGEWQDKAVNNYEAILKMRTASDWSGRSVVYLRNLKAMSEMAAPQESTIAVLNFIDGDELLHLDVESRNTTYQDELHRLFVRVAEDVKRLSQEWAGSKEHFSVYVVSDHGACWILEEEKRSYDSAIVENLFANEKHRFATVPDEQTNEIPQNLKDFLNCCSPISS